MPFCSECGAEVFPDARYCMACGTKVNLRRQGNRPGGPLDAQSLPSGGWEHEGDHVFIYSETRQRTDPNSLIRFFEVELVGESHYPEAFAKVLGSLEDGEERVMEGVMAVLVREPENPDDPKAVSVHLVDASMIDHKAGHLSADDAKDYVETIQKLERRIDQRVGCLATVYGRGGMESEDRVYSARVYLPDPEEWLKWKW